MGPSVHFVRSNQLSVARVLNGMGWNYGSSQLKTLLLSFLSHREPCRSQRTPQKIFDTVLPIATRLMAKRASLSVRFTDFSDTSRSKKYWIFKNLKIRINEFLFDYYFFRPNVLSTECWNFVKSIPQFFFHVLRLHWCTSKCLCVKERRKFKFYFLFFIIILA